MNSNYEVIKSLDWEEIKIPKALNLSILMLIISSIWVGHSFVSFIEFVDFLIDIPWLLLASPLLVFVYIVLHESIHGILMKYFSGLSPQYGFSGLFIFTKSEEVFQKNAYIIITLAPIIILGIISAMLCFIISGAGVWFAIFVWVINLYASRGDLQAIILVKDLPSSYGIKDEGDSLQIYKQ